MSTDYRFDRLLVIREQLKRRGLHDQKVLDAMYKVPRHEFMPEEVRGHAYHDHPTPIGDDQTISQPFIVALTTWYCGIKEGAKVLDIGTGSGYQAAILAAMGAEVYSIEINENLAENARKNLSKFGYKVEIRVGDGYYGWPEKSPFDSIVVAAAPVEIPTTLKEQLALDGRLVIPIGTQGSDQELIAVKRTSEGFVQIVVDSVRFVPMTGEADRKRQSDIQLTPEKSQILIARS